MGTTRHSPRAASSSTTRHTWWISASATTTSATRTATASTDTAQTPTAPRQRQAPTQQPPQNPAEEVLPRWLSRHQQSFWPPCWRRFLLDVNIDEILTLNL